MRSIHVRNTVRTADPEVKGHLGSMQSRFFSGLVALTVLACLPVGLWAAEVQINAPGILDSPGTTYVLTQDVTSPGTAFIIKGNDITLDLGGRTVTYNAQPGDVRYGVVIPPGYIDDYVRETFPDVPAEGIGGADRFHLKNGTIVQGAGGGKAAHGIHFRGGNGLEVEGVTVRVWGPDCDDIHMRYPAAAKIHHSTFYSDVTSVTNRHYPGTNVVGIWHPAGDLEVYDNKVIGGAQWGIRVFADETNTEHKLHIYRNDVRHDTVVTNGYAIGVKAPNMEVYDNVVIPKNGPGIQVSSTGCKIYRNRVEVREGPNAEYPVKWYGAHGIKLEGARHCKVYENTVSSIADPGFGPANALDMNVPRDSFNEVYNNTFRAVANIPDTDKNWATAVNLFALVNGSGTLVRDNLFESNNLLFRIDWDGGSGVTFLRNTFRFTTGLRNPRTGYIWMGRADKLGIDNFFVDCTFEGGASAHDFHLLYTDYAADQIRLTFQSSLALLVRNPSGEPAGGAQVRITRQDGSEVYSGMTDAGGRAEARLSWLTRTPLGESLTGLHTVRVTGAAGTSQFPFEPADGPRSLLVTLGSNTPTDNGGGEEDHDPPKAPAGVGITME
ncbi:MAG: right-handed parallel beta-helix repeat-containing protein [Planctomycetes bacterium]|nr:right-handed parallel beta-helix repeat-containing protein [Planctomycetota bacterium]